MSAGRGDRSAVDMLNRMAPAAAYVKLGEIVDELITKHNALLAKMDADNTALNAAVAGGNLDTDYVATLAVAPLQDRLS